MSRNGDGHLRQARRFINDGRYAKAIALLDPSGGCATSDLWSLALLRLAYERCGNASAAQKALRRSASVRAGDGFTLQAIVQLKTCLRLHDGNHGGIREELAALYMTQGLPDSAQSELVAAIRAYHLADQPEALARCFQALQLPPGRPA